jgi:hypothetical protein
MSTVKASDLNAWHVAISQALDGAGGSGGVASTPLTQLIIGGAGLKLIGNTTLELDGTSISVLDAGGFLNVLGTIAVGADGAITLVGTSGNPAQLNVEAYGVIQVPLMTTKARRRHMETGSTTALRSTSPAASSREASCGSREPRACCARRGFSHWTSPGRPGALERCRATLLSRPLGAKPRARLRGAHRRTLRSFASCASAERATQSRASSGGRPAAPRRHEERPTRRRGPGPSGRRTREATRSGRWSRPRSAGP